MGGKSETKLIITINTDMDNSIFLYGIQYLRVFLTDFALNL